MSLVSGLGNASVSSIPISAIASVTTGLIWPLGARSGRAYVDPAVGRAGASARRPSGIGRRCARTGTAPQARSPGCALEAGHRGQPLAGEPPASTGRKPGDGGLLGERS